LAVDGVAREDVSPLIPRGAGIVSVAVEDRTVIATPDILSDVRVTLTRDLRERMERLAYPAILAAPLRVADRVVGVLCVLDERGRAFTADETGLLRTFASQAALALENARLYDEAQARAARMTRLGEFGRMITSSLNLGEVLERVVAAARELLDADLVRLWVADVPAQKVRLVASHDR